ncbi:MAG TPA: hypothetical protein VHZ07_27470 [Bryobacteraceae bacterium]|nr:hypothetical protein [Bryobacteraceae bacterium]
MSCVHKTIAPASRAPVADNSYLDLVPGGSLRIVVPSLKSGTLPAETQPLQQNGNTFLVSAANLAGYDISYYSIDRAPHGHVRLKFTTAEITRDSKTVSSSQAPALPFPLPLIPQHIRLFYLVRKSRSDHNMAIVASKSLDALNAFTTQLENQPDVCRTDGEIFCSWIPSGIAVRPESQPPPTP